MPAIQGLKTVHSDLNTIGSPSFATRSGRRCRVPSRFTDYSPSSATPLAHLPKPRPIKHLHRSDNLDLFAIPAHLDSSVREVSSSEIVPAIPAEPEGIETAPNDLGLHRVYSSVPSHDPDHTIGLANLCDSPNFQPDQQDNEQNSFDRLVSQSPFPNVTITRLMAWWYGGSGSKSVAELDRLVKDVLTREDFDPLHL